MTGLCSKRLFYHNILFYISIYVTVQALIILGAIAAFSLLNTLAVIFGGAIAKWLPEYIVAASVAILFALFGAHALRINEEEDTDEVIKEKNGHGIFFTTFF